MKKMLLFGLFLFSTIGFAQTFEGTIIDEESKTVISNAVVSIDGTKITTTTDLEGMFSINDELPRGEQVVIIIKEGYVDRYFLIDVTPSRKISAGKIGLEMTKDESKRRKKLRSTQEKEAKNKLEDEEDRIKEVKKQREKDEKRIAKELKKARKKNKNKDVIGEVEEEIADSPVETVPDVSRPIIVDEPMAPTISPIQIKYGALLGVTPEEVTNVELYTFIDEWMGTPYKMGGANPDGIDCSSFAQRLFSSVYGTYIERTAQKQWDSKFNDVFLNKQYLKEGDLIFFGPNEYQITHVGIYLQNNLFVNSTSRKGSSGISGVKISNLSEVYWTNKFVGAGKRSIK